MFVTEQATGAERDTELRATRARAARCAIRSSASARTRRGPSVRTGWSGCRMMLLVTVMARC